MGERAETRTGGRRAAPANPDAVAAALLAAAFLASAGLLLWAQRDLFFGPDELAWIQIATAFPLADQFRPYFSHLIVGDLLAFRATLELFGPDYRAFAALEIAGLGLLAGLVFEYARRRVGPALALAAAVPLLFLGSSWEILMQPLVGITWIYSLAFGLGALLCLERKDRVGDVAAAVLLCLSLACLTAGLAFVAAAAVAVALDPRWRRRIWVAAVPFCAYAAWRLWAAQFGTGAVLTPWGGGELELVPERVVLAPLYVLDSLTTGLAALLNLLGLTGRAPTTSLFLEGAHPDGSRAVLAVAVGALAVAAIVWLVRRGRLQRSAWVAVAVAMGLWLTQAVGLSVPAHRLPGENRYLFASVFVLAILFVELGRGVRWGRAGVVTALVVAGVSAVANLEGFREARAVRAPLTEQLRGRLAAQEAVGRRVSPAPELPGWQAVVERYGGGTPTLAELAGHRDATGAADRTFDELLDPRLVAAPADRPSCRAITAPRGPIAITLPRGGAVIRANARTAVRLRRIDVAFGLSAGVAGRDELVRLVIPRDRSAIPWQARLRADAITLCPLAAAAG